MQLIDGYLLLAVLLVLVAWAVTAVLRYKPSPVVAPDETETSATTREAVPIDSTGEAAESLFQESEPTEPQGDSESEEGGPSDA